LVARSLVVAEDAPSGERRYRLLETIRQYAEERVDDAQRAELRDRHADFCVDFAETATEGLRGPDQLRWLLEVEAELENVRAAIAWSIATNDAARAARFLCSVNMAPGPLARLLLRDAAAVLELPGIATIDRYPLVLRAAGAAALFHGMFERAEQLCQEALDAAGEPSDELAGLAFLVLGNARYGLGDLSGAVQYLERCVAAYRRVGDPFMLAFSLGALASWRPRDLAAVAVDEAREGLVLSRQTGCPGAISGALALLAIILVGTQPEQSRALIAESIQLNDALGDIVVDENALVMSFLVTALLGEREQTLRLTARGLDGGFSMLVNFCACLETTAQTLASEHPHVAATLHGTVDHLVPSLARAEPYRALRKRANIAISPQLDSASEGELHARGATMTEDQATMYALDAIAHSLRTDPQAI
jgi:tetratricopeptide (TPR) repeat protein